MNTITQSVSSAMAEIFPSFEMAEKNSPQASQELNLRMSMINHMLLAVLDNANRDPYFWQNVDCQLFSATLENNKKMLKEMREIFHIESRTLALLDSIQSNISKLEKSLNEYPMFNFDLDRMMEHVNDVFHEAPTDLQSVRDFRNWLKGIANGH